MRACTRIASVIALLILISARFAGATPYILDLSGNNFSTSEAQSTGGELEIVGLLAQVQINPPFALPGILDWTTEYTMHVNGLTLLDPPGQAVKNYSGGTIELWTQAPPNAPFGPATPVALIPAYNPVVVPSTFTDGSLLLRGDFTTFTTLHFAGDTGSITSEIVWVGGSKLAELQALGIDDDWHWNGFFSLVAPPPAGYQYVYGGKIERANPVSVEPSTWGLIKDLWEENRPQ